MLLRCNFWSSMGIGLLPIQISWCEKDSTNESLCKFRIWSKSGECWSVVWALLMAIKFNCQTLKYEMEKKIIFKWSARGCEMYKNVCSNGWFATVLRHLLFESILRPIRSVWRVIKSCTFWFRMLCKIKREDPCGHHSFKSHFSSNSIRLNTQFPLK